jgi:hypothetical protein
MSVELSITLLNAVIIVIAYVWVYPTLAGKNINKVAIFDCVTSGIALVIVANKYWGSGIELKFLLFELNWFWFTLLNYSVIEIPVAIWYFRSSLTKEQ